MIALEIEQGSQAWFEARCGIPTASEFDKIITTKGEPSKQATKYIYKLAGESITKRPSDTFKNLTMARGRVAEDEARAFYEMLTDAQVRQVGVCYKDEARLFSCSPDSLVGEDGCLEIKCPEIQTHVGYLLGGTLPMDYFQQVQGQLFVTERQWCDFFSYYPGLKPLLIRIKRDEVFIKALAAELKSIVKEVKAVTERIR